MAPPTTKKPVQPVPEPEPSVRENLENPEGELLITVITPCYNGGQFTEEAIASVAAQTEGRFEYLIVDDESTDGTDILVEQAIAGDSRMRLIRIPHGGSAVARNVGLKEARGQYISFLDGDDLWHPTKLEAQLRELGRVGPQYASVFSWSRLVSEDGVPVGGQRAPRGTYDFDQLLVDNCPMGNGSSLLLHRSCFEEVGDFNPEATTAADLDMWLRIAKYSSTPLFWCDGEARLDYRLHSGQETKSLTGLMNSVDRFLDLYTPDMNRLPKQQAYVYHAVTAYKANDSERIDRWGAQAWQCSVRHLLTRPEGRRLIGWRLLGPFRPLYRIVTSQSLRLGRQVVRSLFRHSAKFRSASS